MTIISISDFSEAHQKHFGSSIEFHNVRKNGPDHCPTARVDLTTRDGEYTGAGNNRKVAQYNAVQKAAAEAVVVGWLKA